MPQIISASRRTDVPAFHIQWLISRMDEGFVRVQNPMNPRQISTISLLPQDVDGFVFWSKNPEPLLSCRDRFRDFPYYIQYTLNPYGERAEPYVPPLGARLATFARWTKEVGERRVLWRYDPIFLTDELPDVAAHIVAFTRLADALAGKTRVCTISFLQPYRKAVARMGKAGIREVNEEERAPLAATLRDIAAERGIELRACAMNIPGVPSARCVDAELIASIAHKPISRRKASGQREACGCSHSADIGSYNTCPHACAYCYANL